LPGRSQPKANEKNPGQNFTSEPNNALTFLITPDTVIDAKLKVGGSASMVYQPDDRDNNVAVSVTVAP